MSHVSIGCEHKVWTFAANLLLSQPLVPGPDYVPIPGRAIGISDRSDEGDLPSTWPTQGQRPTVVVEVWVTAALCHHNPNFIVRIEIACYRF